MLSSYILHKSMNVSHNLISTGGPNTEICYFTLELVHSCAYECLAYHRVSSLLKLPCHNMAMPLLCHLNL